MQVREISKVSSVFVPDLAYGHTLEESYEHQHSEFGNQHVDDNEHGHEHGHDHKDRDQHPHSYVIQHHKHEAERDHDHEHEHGEKHSHGFFSSLLAALHVPGFGHTHEPKHGSDAIFANELGVRTVRQALVVLGITSVLQLAIYAISGSVALLADTVHNIGDALNSVPLLMAFIISRKLANKRYTYGYGRAEDLAGLVIVLSIVFSAGVIFWETIQRFINPQPLENAFWVVIAAVIGFLGNEWVANLQIRVGRQIGSEAMLVDGKHARVDGITSLAVLVAAASGYLNTPWLDPVVGALIGLVVVFIAIDAVRSVWYRMMDAVDPRLTEQIEGIVAKSDGVRTLTSLRLRWAGHELLANIEILADGGLSLQTADALRETVSAELMKAIPSLRKVSILIRPDKQR